MVRQAAPWLWFVVFGGACSVALLTRRPPADAPVWPSVAAAAAFAGLAAAFGAPLVAQLATGAVVAIGMVLLFTHWRRLLHEDRLPPGVGGNRLVDMVGEVTHVIDPTIDGPGRVGHVTMGGEEWRAVAVDDRVHAVGSTVEVIRVRGTTLEVVGPTSTVDIGHGPHHGGPPDARPDARPGGHSSSRTSTLPERPNDGAT